MYLALATVLVMSTIIFGSRYKYLGAFISSFALGYVFSQRSLSVGNDTYAYNYYFNRVQNNLSVKEYEIVYHYIFLYSPSFRFVLFLTSFLSLLFFQLAMVKFRLEEKLSAIILMVSFGYLNIMVDQSRQILAISFFLWLFGMALTSRWNLFYGIGASFIHKSMLLLGLLGSIKLDRKISGYLLIIITLLSYYVGKKFIVVFWLVKIIRNLTQDSVYVDDRFFLTILDQSGNLILIRVLFAIILAFYACRGSLSKGIILWFGLIVQIISAGFMPLERIGDVLVFFGVFLFIIQGHVLTSKKFIISIFYISNFLFYILTQYLQLGKHGSLPWKF